MTENTVANNGNETARRPGRPRTPDHDERILDAVADMVDNNEDITVNAVVRASGVSRAALYRRWSSMTELIATALDRGRSAAKIQLTGSIKEAVTTAIFSELDHTVGKDYTEQRFRKRVHLVMANPELQDAYWQSHVYRRRHSMSKALQLGIDRGELRADLDIEAAIDALNGIFYYQLVARGSSLEDPDTQRRCREAFDVVWRGMEN